MEYIIHFSPASVKPRFLKRMAALLVIVCPLMANAGDNYRATDTWAEDFARMVLDSLAPNAILFTYGDADVFTIGYVHHVLGHRPDVTLYNVKGTVFSNRLFKPYTLSQVDAEEKISRFIESVHSPVYYTYRFPHKYGETDFGLFMKIDKQNEKEQQQAVILPEVRQYFERLLARGEPVDDWEKMHYRILMALNCLQSVRMDLSSLSSTASQYNHEEWIARVCNNFQAKMLRIAYLLGADSSDEELPALIEQAEELKYRAIAKSELAQLENYKQQMGQRNDSVMER